MGCIDRLGAVLPEVDPEEGVRGGRLLAVPPPGAQRTHLRERVAEHRPALDRLVAPLDLNASTPFDSLAYRFDIVLRGQRKTHFENR